MDDYQDENNFQDNHTDFHSDSLAAHIRTAFTVAASARQEITERIRKCKYAVDKKYSPDELETIRKIGSNDKYFPLTKSKIRSTKAWFKKILQSADRPWAIEPTPVPDLPEYTVNAIRDAAMREFQRMSSAGMQVDDTYQFARDMRAFYEEFSSEDASRCAEKMSRRIEDVIVDGNFDAAFDLFLLDLATFPAAFMRAAIHMDKKRSVTKNPETGTFDVSESNIPKLFFERINPVRVFPAPGATSISDGDLIIIDLKSVADIHALRDTPGYSPQAIAGLIESRLDRVDSDNSGADVLDMFPEAKFYGEAYRNYSSVVCLEYYGSASGRIIKEWCGGGTVPGINGEPVENEYYDIHAIVAENFTLFCEVMPSGSAGRMVYSASFSRNPDSVWGEGVADIISDCQRSVNSAYRTLSDNLAFCSYPQVIVNTGAMFGYIPGQRIPLHPGKVWYCESSGYSGSKLPVEFANVPNQQAALSAEIQSEINHAERLCGVPEYAQGLASGATNGAAGTASGLAQLMESAVNQIKDPLSNVDEGLIKPLITDLYYSLMQDPETPADCKGDFRIRPRGACGLAVKEQQLIRRKEFLGMVLGNQILMSIVKPEGVIRLIREVVQNLDLPVNKIVPSDTERSFERQQGEAAAVAQRKELVQTLISIDAKIADGSASPEEAEKAKMMIYRQLAGEQHEAGNDK